MNNINFAIILPTYNRPSQSARALQSVIDQRYPHWKLVLVIDDTESDYNQTMGLASARKEVTVIQNEWNLGKNASVNKALRKLEEDLFDGYIIFLDDDDWLSGNCLEKFSVEIKKSKSKWLVANRTDRTFAKKLTHNKTGRIEISYIKDMLLFRRFSGETTQCIYFEKISGIYLPETVKNAEEWVYYAHISKILGRFVYIDFDATFTDGYGADGLSLVKQKKVDRLVVFIKVFKEVLERKIRSSYVYLYLLARLIRIIFTRG